MRRSPFFNAIHRALTIARLCERRRLSTADGLSLASEAEHAAAAQRTRREWMTAVGRAGVAGVAASVATPIERLWASRPGGAAPSIGIVGAGLAGLACADALARRGIVATVYDADVRTGGRCWSLRGFFPGQVAERGGELIDNPHKTMIGYAKRFGLALEDVTKKAGDTVYHFNGQHVPEVVIVDEFREFVHIMRTDLRRLSPEVTAWSHTSDDVAIDNTSLAAYLAGNNGAGTPAPSLAAAAITEAYEAEYGLEADEQSALNFLLFIHADRRSKFTPFGVFSDERYHLVDGNDGIVAGLTAALPKPVELGKRLVAAQRTASGAIELTFDGGGAPKVHDVVVFAIPFTLLRTVALHANLGIMPAQQLAIDELGYGLNAKMMVGFNLRPWTTTHGSSGTAYSDLPNYQLTWETNRIRATATRGILTNYASGDRGRLLDSAPLQVQVEAFLDDLDVVYPGAAAFASRRQDGSVVAHLEHWPTNPFARGSYTCYLPGQFTTLAGVEGLQGDGIYFAGEHANSFYVWQGFMEGAALSGLDVAAAILSAVKK